MSFGALCKIYDSMIALRNVCMIALYKSINNNNDFRNATPSTVFIKFQANFIQSIVIGANIGYYFFW